MNLGTDFSMIQQYFPCRTRAQIKRKYKTEEKKNPELINGALANSIHYDGLLIENMFQEDDPEPIEETKVHNHLETNKKPINRKRRHKKITRTECKRISVCAYMMEEETEIKNKKKQAGRIASASELKEDILALQSLRNEEQNIKKSVPDL